MPERLDMEDAVNQPVISVFGSHAPMPGSNAYEQARVLGDLLAHAGYAVATGGYSGIMEAVSRGVAQAGGHVIGVTSSQIELYRGAKRNAWVRAEVKYKTLRERVLHLVENNQGMIVLPGGVGTLSEFALAWSLLQVREIPPRPLVLLGEMWRESLATFVRPEYVSQDNLKLIGLASSPADAVARLEVDREGLI